MDIKLSEEQVQLRDTARKFMQEECTPAFVREMEKSEFGFSKAMWRQMAEMGWLGIALPEDCGGLEMSTLDLVLLAKELGRRICPSPFLSTAVTKPLRRAPWIVSSSQSPIRDRSSTTDGRWSILTRPRIWPRRSCFPYFRRRLKPCRRYVYRSPASALSRRTCR